MVLSECLRATALACYIGCGHWTFSLPEPGCHWWKTSKENWDQQSIRGTLWPWLWLPLNRFLQTLFYYQFFFVFDIYNQPWQLLTFCSSSTVFVSLASCCALRMGEYPAWLLFQCLTASRYIRHLRYALIMAILIIPPSACFTAPTGKLMCRAPYNLATLMSRRARLLSWGSCSSHHSRTSLTSTFGCPV